MNFKFWETTWFFSVDVYKGDDVVSRYSGVTNGSRYPRKAFKQTKDYIHKTIDGQYTHLVYTAFNKL